MNCLVFKEPPEDFAAEVKVAGCYCSCNGKMLFLKRHSQKPQGDTWGIPGGKIEDGETPRMAVIRETFEEVGLNIDDEALQMIAPLYCRLPHLDYVYYLFYKPFKTFPEIELALEEHTELRWVTFEEALMLPLIGGGAEALKFVVEMIKDL